MKAIAPLLFVDPTRTVTTQMVKTAPMRHLPFVFIPAYLVPTFTIFHLIALFQARRLSSLEAVT
jgi:hypothetical protein